ncbi:hypothetical protein VPH35_127981 [Triticum aestivum]|uniref:KIB1-4 beta-propeller domain-containing protein n=1 Tax=Triticum aestivum TaxID=4565 RepID=A0A3B6SFL8_WHEAT|nr:uncharacterized protein LOC123161736 [Triticum aestivum]
MEMSTSFPLPCLAMVHGVGAEHQQPTATTLFSLAGARPLTGVALEEELKNKSVCPTPQGWVLVQHRDAAAAAATYLLDPRSSQRIDLPHLAIQQGLIPYCSCLLAGDPTAPGCPVLVVEPMATLLWCCRVGDGEWTRHDYDIGTLGDEHFVEKRVIAPIAACRGRFYFNAVPAETRVLELARPGSGAPAFSSVATEPAEADRFGRARVFMVGTDDDELYKVVLLHHGGSYDEARVLKMDLSERRWRPVEDLGGRAFFVAPMYFGASCAPTGGRVRQDCIYSLVGVARNTFRVFSLKDGTSEVRQLEEEEEEQPAPETVGKSRPCWVLPTHPTS